MDNFMTLSFNLSEWDGLKFSDPKRLDFNISTKLQLQQGKYPKHFHVAPLRRNKVTQESEEWEFAVFFRDHMM